MPTTDCFMRMFRNEPMSRLDDKIVFLSPVKKNSKRVDNNEVSGPPPSQSVVSTTLNTSVPPPPAAAAVQAEAPAACSPHTQYISVQTQWYNERIKRYIPPNASVQTIPPQAPPAPPVPAALPAVAPAAATPAGSLNAAVHTPEVYTSINGIRRFPLRPREDQIKNVRKSVRVAEKRQRTE